MQLHFDLPQCIDSTLLRTEATQEEYEKLANGAIKYDMYSVVVLPRWVSFMSDLLRDTEVNICAVVGFPLANLPLISLVTVTEEVLCAGANEIDMCISLGKFFSGYKSEVLTEIRAVKKIMTQIALEHNIFDLNLKVIIESHLFDKIQLTELCDMLIQNEVDFVKTHSGFVGNRGVKEEDVRLLKDIVGDKLKIKAASDITYVEKAIGLITAGADRIGTSCGAIIVQEWLDIQS